jgi:hypothetical protein
MMQAGMHCTRINQVCKCHLMNASQTLVPGMRDHLKNKWVIDGNKTVYGVINDLSYAVCHSLPAILLKLLPKAAGKSTKPGGIN